MSENAYTLTPLEDDERKRLYTHNVWKPIPEPQLPPQGSKSLSKCLRKHCIFDLGKGTPFQGGFPVITDRVIKVLGF